ncbi:hypothetical protein NEMIN01_2233 [Nematocida minor]|uniref:uncharacterized protein n=1 Tax=Nematocida minor TaxID=1912983 RepID=UPI00221FB5FC|nr:uncharacterized protein NEMIN01_2233 [Nematocida minor]KAI5192817.1 hypothetical protein NEMIN01_2233 [Nematocida minor]
MYNISTLLLLGNSSLTVLFVSIVYAACVKNSNKDLFLFLLLSKICTFFLFSRGILLQRTVDQKYAIYVVVYEMLSILYLYHISLLAFVHMATLLWSNSAYILTILLGIYNTYIQHSWRRHRRLLSGEIDILYYNLTVSSEILSFISRFASSLYLMSDNTVVSKILILSYLVINMWGTGGCLLASSAFIVLWSFKDVLLAQSISGITLFVLTSIKFGFLLADRYLQWSIKNASPKRIALE